MRSKRIFHQLALGDETLCLQWRSHDERSERLDGLNGWTALW